MSCGITVKRFYPDGKCRCEPDPLDCDCDNVLNTCPGGPGPSPSGSGPGGGGPPPGGFVQTVCCPKPIPKILFMEVSVGPIAPPFPPDFPHLQAADVGSTFVVELVYDSNSGSWGSGQQPTFPFAPIYKPLPTPVCGFGYYHASFGCGGAEAGVNRCRGQIRIFSTAEVNVLNELGGSVYVWSQPPAEVGNAWYFCGDGYFYTEFSSGGGFFGGAEPPEVISAVCWQGPDAQIGPLPSGPGGILPARIYS